MQQQPEVTLVSAFGRGNWLAAELAEHGFSVLLIDVSESLGRWAPEDWEGPFGFFQHDDLLNSQVHRLDEEDYADAVADGFTVWLKDGPLDMRGMLVPYWLETLPAMASAKRYIQSYTTLTRPEVEDQQEELLLAGFQRNWLAQLAHQLASPVFLPNALALESGRPLPLFAPFSIRRTTRKGLQKSLDWCREKGVEVMAGARLVDVVLEGRNCAGVQVTGEVSRVVVGENVVWGLSSGETQMLSKNAAEVLFPKGTLEPEWIWMRWRLRGSLGDYAAVPRHFVMIGDLGLPWTHANMLVIQRSVMDDTMDVWGRVPAHHRFQRAYIERVGQQICDSLAERCPGLKLQVQDWPQDYHYDIGEIGPALFPVYDAEKREKWEARELKNLHFDGPEWVENMDWTGRFARQNEIHQALVKWKQLKVAKAAKKNGDIDDKSVHAP